MAVRPQNGRLHCAIAGWASAAVNNPAAANKPTRLIYGIPPLGVAERAAASLRAGGNYAPNVTNRGHEYCRKITLRFYDLEYQLALDAEVGHLTG